MFYLLHPSVDNNTVVLTQAFWLWIITYLLTKSLYQDEHW